MASSTNKAGAVVGLHDPNTGALVGLRGSDGKEVSLSGAPIPAGLKPFRISGLHDHSTGVLVGLAGALGKAFQLGAAVIGSSALIGAVVGMHDALTGALVGLRGSDGIEVPLFGGGGGTDPTLRTLADLETYRTSGTPGQPDGSFAGVPFFDLTTGLQEQWSGESALGGGLAKLVMDIDVGAGAAPVNGRPIACLFHPTTNSGYKNWMLPGAALYGVKVALLAAGYVVINAETRHPSTTLDSTPAPTVAPWLDVSYAIQHARALHAALDLDRSKLDVVCRSRGSLAVWEALQADRALPGSAIYAAQQSTAIRFCYVMQGQITYRGDHFADYYIVPADRNAAKLANPTDPRLQNPAYPDHLECVPGTNTATKFFMDTDQDWYAEFVTLAFTGGKDVLHWPNYSMKFRNAMADRGKAGQVAVQYSTPPGAPASYSLVVPWFLTMDAAQTAGMAVTAAEAMAIVTAKAADERLYYLRPDGSGGFATFDGGTQTGSGALVVGGTVGALVDGREGLPNRLLGNSAVGTPAANGAGTKPTVTQIGAAWALSHAASQFLQVTVTNSAATEVWAATPTGWTSGLFGRAAGNFKLGGPGGAAMTAGLYACKVSAAISEANQRIYRQAGAEISGYADSLT